MSKRRILLADDSLTIQKVVNLTFADEGIEVVTADNGDQAMQKFVEAVPDLVMADVSMPGLDGYRLCEFIKQDDETKTIPVILLVGSFEPFDEAEARRVGADDFLTKPFQSIRQLADKVSALLDAKVAEDNFLLRPVENRDAPVGAFAEDFETAPDDEFDSADESIENLGDAGMDDEMIQTAQIGSLPVDEIHKFESEPIDESYTEDAGSKNAEQPTGFESLTDELEDKNWAKTEFSSAADLEKNADAPSRENVAAPPSLNFDDLDLLDFPQTINKQSFSETSRSTDSEISDEAPPSISDTPVSTPEAEFKTSGVSTRTENLSTEAIEAIADRVVEKLSNKVIARIVNEVISQMERKS